MAEYNHKECVKKFGENLDKIAKIYDDLRKDRNNT